MDMNELFAVLHSLALGLPTFLIHLITAFIIWIISIIIYYYSTPLRTLSLAKEGNLAAAITFSGAILGLALPLAFCLSGSTSVWDIIVWSIPIALLQIATFFLFNRIIGDLAGRIARDVTPSFPPAGIRAGPFCCA